MKLRSTLIHWILLSCRRATQLIEKKLHFGLNPVEEIQLGWHKKACSYCKSYEQQNTLIHHVLMEKLADDIDKEAKHFSEEEKRGMISEIENRIAHQ